MAGKTLKGLIIEIGGDTTKLGKALDDVDRRSKGLSSALKEIDKQLKFDPTNTELVAEKQKVLSQQIEATSDKLKLLREHEEEVRKAFERGDDVATEKMEKLHREIVITESTLNSQKEALAETTDYLKGLEDGSIDAAEAEAEMQKKTDEANRELEEQKAKAAEAKKELGEYAQKGAKVAETAIAALGTAVAGTAAALSTLVLKEAENADELGDMSKKTGLSIEKLQEYKYVAVKLGTDLETVTGAHTKLVKSMDSAKKGTGDTADAYKTLGIRVADANGKLRNADDVFLEAIDRLSKMEDGTERDALAMKIFGKSAQELNPLILAGSEGIKEYTDRAHELGAVVSGETISALADVQDGVKDVIFQFSAAKQELAAEFAPVAKEVISALSDLIKRGKDQLKDPKIRQSLRALGDSLAKLVRSAADLAVKALPKVIDALKWLTDHGKTCAIVLGSLWALFKGVSIFTTASKAISSVTSALKTLKGASGEAEAAQSGLSKVFSSGTLKAAGWVGAIIAVIAVLQKLCDQHHDSIVQIKTEAAQASTELRESIASITEALGESRDAYRETIDKSESAASRANDYLDRLEVLESQVSLTSDEQDEYNRLLFELSQLMPDINLEIDSNTGKLKNGAAAIRDQVKAIKERARAAAIEKGYSDAISRGIELEKKRAEIEKNLAEAEKKLNGTKRYETPLNYLFDGNNNGNGVTGIRMLDRLLSIDSWDSAQTAASSAYSAAKAASDEYSAAVEENNRDLEYYEGLMSGVNWTLIYFAGTADDAGNAVKGFNAELDDAGKKADEFAQDHLSKIIGTAQNMFEVIDTGSRTSMRKLIDTLKRNREAMNEWNDDLMTIKARGASEEFVQYLESLGLGYADAVDMIANSTDEEFEELLSQWDENTEAAYNAAYEYGQTMISKIVEGIWDKVDSLRDAMRSVVSAVLDVLAGRNNDLIRAGADAAAAVDRGFRNRLEIRSPSHVMERNTDDTVDAVENRLYDRTTDIEKASSAAAQAVEAGFDPVLGVRINTGVFDRAFSSPSQPFFSQMGADVGALSSKLDAILGAIERGQIIALDGDKLVGGTLGRINAELGSGLILAGRRAM